ncbi:class I SAM-dependent DNA methyltransferase [Actinokineospora globicatena]|uniref:class I SAM-dependent DNA methyltransferase n=1 Tax=Actinokineospora globicatena TaxID=103729 RepID=UPI002554C5E6|nr:class I SAM-dependent methyltransferase [Actinokineospora globicatena]MCP2303330.1 Methyltransferase domain-containing protein [Actinokineospora globicatena]GLW79537.1 methyltransferase [Actinokineospora globicatena]GLW86053.1 methyltransferase [Actinokineospora globicatena]
MPARTAQGRGPLTPDSVFADPRLVAVYDTFDAPRDDLDAYVALVAELDARRVLDLGCGTGNLGVRLAERGIDVIGVDPAEASLAVARGREERVRWVHGDVGSAAGLDVDLVVMTGNVAQVFLTDAEWTEVLAGCRAATRPGGYLVFETRRPQRRAWEEWDGQVVLDVPGIGAVSQRREVTEVRLPLVSFRSTYRFPDGAVISSSTTLRFRDLDEISRDLAAHGYRVLDVREAPDRPGKEFVFVAQASALVMNTLLGSST